MIQILRPTNTGRIYHLSDGFNMYQHVINSRLFFWDGSFHGTALSFVPNFGNSAEQYFFDETTPARTTTVNGAGI